MCVGVNHDTDGLVFDLGSLYDYLCRLPDTRRDHGTRYALVTVLVYVVLAKLAGENHLAGIAEWVAYRIAPLTQALQLTKVRAPHRTTYSRILGHVIAVDDFHKQVNAFFAAQPRAGTPIQIALDGKTLRGTIPAGQSKGVHLLAAFVPDDGCVLIQVAVDGKENEISAAPRVLGLLDLRGKVVTGDAMLAQRALSVQIVEAGGDYVWTVKDNHPDLKEAIVTLFAPEGCRPGFAPAVTEFRTAKTVEKGHGRIEERTLTASTDLTGYLDWPHAQQVFTIERRFKRVVDGKITHEVVYGVTSLSAAEASADTLLAYARAHWQIENGLHYRRDQTLREDWCQVRAGHAAQVLAAINNLVTALILRQGQRNLPHARRRYAAHWQPALNLLLRC